MRRTAASRDFRKNSCMTYTLARRIPLRHILAASLSVAALLGTAHAQTFEINNSQGNSPLIITSATSYNQTLSIGGQAGTTGQLTLNGGSLSVDPPFPIPMSESEFRVIDLLVGQNGGTGTVLVQDGTLSLSNTVYRPQISIGDGSGSVGQISVIGEDASIAVRTSLGVTIGTNGGRGALSIDGGTLSLNRNTFSPPPIIVPDLSLPSEFYIEDILVDKQHGEISITNGGALAIELQSFSKTGVARLNIGHVGTPGVDLLVSGNESVLGVSSGLIDVTVGGGSLAATAEIKDGALMILGQGFNPTTGAEENASSFTSIGSRVDMSVGNVVGTAIDIFSNTERTGGGSTLTVSDSELVLGAVGYSPGATAAIADNSYGFYNRTISADRTGFFFGQYPAVEQTNLVLGENAGELGSLGLSGDSGSVIMYGANSKVSVGAQGQGVLTVSDGARLFIRNNDESFEALAQIADSVGFHSLTVAEQAGSSGNVLLTSGGVITIAGSAYIGGQRDGLGAGGQARLTVADGGNLRAGRIKVGGASADLDVPKELILDGGRIDADVVISRGGTLTGSGHIAGAVGIDGGTVTINNGDAITASRRNGVGSSGVPSGISNSSTSVLEIGTAGFGSYVLDASGPDFPFGSDSPDLLTLLGNAELTIGANGGNGQLSVIDAVATIGESDKGFTTSIDIGVDGGVGALALAGSEAKLYQHGLSTINVGANGGTGTLTIDQGAAVEVVLSGLVTGLSQSQVELAVGDRQTGVGSVVIQGGGTLLLGNQQTDGMAIASVGSAGGNGTVGVSGIGSVVGVFAASEAIVSVGNAGTGAITLTDHASMGVQGGFNAGGATSYAGLSVGQNAGGLGTLDIGVHAVLAVINLAFGSDVTSIDPVAELTVGDQFGGHGQVRVYSGGTLQVANDQLDGTARLLLGSSSGTSSALTITDAESLATIVGHTGVVRVGGDGTTGTLAISNGATLAIGKYDFADPLQSSNTASSLILGASTYSDSSDSALSGAGVLNIDSGALIVGAIDLAFGETSALADNSYTLIDSAGNYIGSAQLTLGQGVGDSGTMTVTGVDGLVLLGGRDATLKVGQLGTGSLAVTNGAKITANTDFLRDASLHTQIMTVGDEAGSTGSLIISGVGSLVEIGDDVYIGAGSDGLGAGGRASVTVADGGTLRAGGRVQLGGDNADTSFTRTLTLQNGTIDTPELIIAKGGLLNGSGIVTGDMLVRGGRVSTGFSPGALTVDGDLVISDGGTLEVEIAGRNSGEFDVYTVLGSADLSSGSIVVSLLNSFVPSVSDSFTFLTATEGVTLPTDANETTIMSTGESVSYQLAQNSETGAIDIVVTAVGGSSGGTVEVQEEIITETTQTEAATVTRAVVTAISSRVRAYQRAPTGQINQPDLQGLGFGTMVGVAGGDSYSGLNFWTDGTVTRLNSDNATSPFDGYTETMLFGADKLLGDGKLVIGFAGGLDNTNLSLKGLGGERDSFGGSATIYAGYLLNETFSLDGQVGVGRYNNDIANHQGNGTTISGGYKSNRLQSSLNVSANKQIDQWSLYASGGYSWLQDRAHSYTASDGNFVSPGNTTLGQFRFTGEAAYQLTEKIQPYATATYEIDSVTTGSSDPTGLLVGVGVRAPLADNITFGASASGQVLRDKEDAYALNVNLRFSF